MRFSQLLCIQCVKLYGFAVEIEKRVSYISTRCLSRSAIALFPIKKRREPMWPTVVERKAQQKLKIDEYPENVEAQNKRLPWEYPLQADQRSTWKHRRWYDIHFDRWVDTMPKIKGKYTISYKDQRQLLFEAETPPELFYLLLDRYARRKYIIESFNHETPISNLSYYYQYLTHTKYVHGMPYCIEHATVDEVYLNKLRSFVNDILMMRHNVEFEKKNDPLEKEQILKENFFSAIIQHLVATLSSENTQLLNCEVDLNVENSLFWLKGRGFLKWTQSDDMPVAHQCHDKSFLQIRTSEQLPEFSPWLGEFSTVGEIPSFYTTPHVFRLGFKQYRNMISPGYRLFGGDITQNYQNAYNKQALADLPPPIYNPCPFGHTQLCLLPKEYSREWYKDNLEHSDITGEIEEHLKGRGIMSGWVWTASQAHYALHWMDSDVNKPFCSQNIVTDGQWLSFFCYQLNTIGIDPDNIDENNKRNICYGLPSVKLYDEITPNGVVGLNDDALRMLIKFVANGKQQHEAVVTSNEVVEDYNKSLHVQQCDPDAPEIELQKPLQKIALDRRKEIEEEELRKKENENKTLKMRIMSYFK